ncbi:alpha-2-macroglobulin family protein [Sandarakinorhabdus sp.]|uniref:alpha-2-macroglobulin family protein n=1 Tax=Sandarakinorhabdus sp. TaxID=1916663 RepID=UPI0028A6D7F0|nr:alpha-2-macroglobulin family protein [Sandarakinorhabdus sp.]
MPWRLLGAGLLLGLTAMPLIGQAQSLPRPGVAGFSPEGTMAAPRQIVVRFATPMVALGGTASAPISGACAAGGKGQWLDPQRFAIDLPAGLPGGRACSFALAPGLKDLAGRPLPSAGPFRFTTPGPSLRAIAPDYEELSEDQIFLIASEAPPTPASLATHAACLIEGVGEKIPLDPLPDATRDAIFKGSRGNWNLNWFLEQAGWRPSEDGEARTRATITALHCRRPLPPGGKVTILWGKGVAAANGLTAGSDWQRRFTVRQAFTARIECTRVNAGAACSPLDSIRISFTAPVPRAAALQARLVQGGRAIAPEEPKDRANTLQEVRFKGPLPARTSFTITLPAALADDSGRRLANAERFPLPIATADYPPLAKFAGTFGILEAEEGGVLPVTLRGVESPLPASMLALPTRSITTTNDADIAGWLRQLERAEERTFRSEPLSDGGNRSIETTRSQPLIPASQLARRFTVARAKDGAMQVVGIPLKTRGFHVVEIASPLLGNALLGPGNVRHVATGALVTNMAVHFQWGDGASLAWVTRLSDATPVAGAAVRVSDGCSGKLLWQGKSDSRGRTPVPAGLPRPSSYTGCERGQSAPLLISARTADDYSFALSSWGRGIQGYDFNLPTGDWQGGALAHAVLDRTLARPGERINLKLFERVSRDTGFARAPAGPRTLTARHWASDTVLPVTLDASSDPVGHVDLPATAPAGDWDLRLAGDEERSVGRFQVEDFRLPTSRAGVSGPKAIPVAPRSLPLDLALSYLSGGGAGGTPVTLRTRVVPRSVEMPGYDGWRFDAEPVKPGLAALDGDGNEAGATASAQRATEQPLTLGPAGTARVTATSWPAITAPSTLVAEMDYPDANGEVATKVTRLKLDPAAVRIGIATDGWLSKADDLRLKLVVLDLAGKPVRGQKISVRLFAREILSTRKRLVGGFYAYDNARETRELKATCSASSDDRGRATCVLDAGVSGEVLALAETTDSAGRTARATQSLWLAGDDDWWFGGDNGDRMDLVPEAPEVAANGTARLQVRMPFRSATALVTVLRGGVMESFVTTLSGKDPVVEVKMKGEYAPNVYVSVLAVRGRVAGWRLWLADLARRWNLPWLSREGAYPTALVDLAKPSYRLGLAQLKVGHDARRLAVQVVPEKQTHAVKEQASALVTVKPQAAGTRLPADAEIAFAAVDEALLQLKDNESWKLLDAMMAPRPLGVVLATAQGQVVGKRHYGAKAVAAGGGGGALAMQRRDFQPVIVWVGRVKLDGNGQARVPFRLNDSLSGFRLVAIASAGPGLFGTGSASIRTTQDLQILPGIPPLVRTGDAYVATMVVRNTTARSLPVTITASADTTRWPAKPITLAAGAAQTIAFAATAPAAGKLMWKLGASGGGATDAVQVEQIVEPAVPPAVITAALTRAGFAVAVPAGALPDSAFVTVALSPSLGGNLSGMRAYMAAYPYDCIEQRLSKAVALGDRAMWDREVASLATWMDDRGLLRFFPNAGMRGDVDLTAYVLRLSRLSGWPLPAAEQARMLAGLRPVAEGRVAGDRLAALAALAGEGEAVGRMLAGFNAMPDQWGPSALLDWRAVQLASGNGPAAAQVLARLRARLDDRGTVMRFTGPADEWSLMSGRDAALARLLLVATADPAWAGDAPRLARALVQGQSQGHWDTTPANALGRLALAGFATRFEQDQVSGRTSVALGAVRQVAMWPNPVPIRLPATTAPLTISHAGSGQPWAMVSISAAVPASKPVANGLSLRRQIVPVRQAVPGRWSRGDVLAVRLTIQARAQTAWVALTDPVPAGATILGGGLGGRSELLNEGEASAGQTPDWVERRTGHYRAYWQQLGAAPVTVEYRIRLGSSGRFILPPAQAEAMYAPDINALMPGGTLVVAEPK